MSTSNLMSLPVDIPWKRLGTSRDMIDRIAGDRIYPPKWRSSLAVFYYEPSAEEQKFTDRIITYVKVSCSITGFQVGGRTAEVRMPPNLLLKDWERKVWDNYNQKVLSYYPCYGAIIQVAVFPRGSANQRFAVDKYPFIQDFEPKKREMYESATESNEILSQSRSTTRVKKGTTSLDYSEFFVEFGSSGGYSSGGVEATGHYDTGHKRGTQTETVDIVTADYSREQRENYSYTTSVSHMYHLLNAYHIGTNRAVFFIQPRPHIIDSEYTFVNGPRQLEGIQEFFLVVERPKEVPGFCVEATLETAHLEMKPAWIPRVIPVTDLYKNENYKKTAAALGLSATDKGAIGRHLELIVNGWWEDKPKLFSNPKSQIDNDADYLKDNGRVCLVRGWNNLGAGERAKLLKFSTSGDSNDIAGISGAKWHYIYNKISKKDDTKAWERESPWYLVGLASWVYGYNDKVGSLRAEVIYERVQQNTGRLFLTGRTTTNCTTQNGSIFTPKGAADFLTYEKQIPLPEGITDILSGNKERAAVANRAVEIIGHEMIQSLSSPERLPYGKIEVHEAAFIQDSMAEAMAGMPDEDPYNSRLEEIDGLDPELCTQLVEVFGVERRKEALGIDLYQLRTALDLTDEQARRLRSQIIGEGPVPQGQPGEIIVPQVVGMLLDEARETLAKARLTATDDVAYQDGLETRDTVLNQFPDAGTSIDRQSTVKLVVSSGPVVVPDVTGMHVEEAAARLKEISLKVEWTYTPSKAQPEDHVLESTPAAGTTVPCNSQVVLLVSAKAAPGSRKPDVSK